MFFSLRHFLSVMLLGSLLNFPAFATFGEKESSDGGGAIQMPCLPPAEYRRAKVTARVYDISSDVLKPIESIRIYWCRRNHGPCLFGNSIWDHQIR